MGIEVLEEKIACGFRRRHLKLLMLRVGIKDSDWKFSILKLEMLYQILRRILGRKHWNGFGLVSELAEHHPILAAQLLVVRAIEENHLWPIVVQHGRSVLRICREECIQPS